MNQSSPSAERGRVALVTGAAGIIGPGICEELQAAGWKIAAAEFNHENFAEFEKINGHPIRADLLVSGDLSKREECFHLVREVTDALGSIALVVNNATGQITAPPPFAELDEAACDRVLRVDLLAPIYLSQAANADLEMNRGLIVNLSSVLIHNLGPGRMIYTAAKAAVEKLTESLAIEFRDQGIRVNALRVGSIPGDSFLRPALRMASPKVARRLHTEIMQRFVQEISSASALSGRAGRSSDIGKMIAFLASPSGEFINGAVIPVDGAFSLLQQMEAYSNCKGLDLIRQWTENPKGELEKWLVKSGGQDGN